MTSILFITILLIITCILIDISGKIFKKNGFILSMLFIYIYATIESGFLINIYDNYIPLGTLFFPLTYVIGNILLKKYDIDKKFIIYGGILVQLFMVITSTYLLFIMKNSYVDKNLINSLNNIFSQTPRIVISSLIAGTIVRFTQIKMVKVDSKLSQLLFQFLDTFLFMFFSFIGIIQISNLFISSIIIFISKFIIAYVSTFFLERGVMPDEQ